MNLIIIVFLEMNLLRRPLRPRLRPLLLNEIPVDGQSEPLSPLSSVSSSPSNSTPSSRQSSRTKSPHFLAPLTDEASHHVSLVTPFQSEQPTLVDRLTIAIMDDIEKGDHRGIDETDEDDDEEEKRIPRKKRSRLLLAPLKPREFSQFSALHTEMKPPKPRTLNRTPKFKGPPALPPRKTRSYRDVKSNYARLTDDDAYTIINEFTFNDFILHAAVSNAHSYEECTLEKCFLSRYTYKQICEMIAERVCAERGESGKVNRN